MLPAFATILAGLHTIGTAIGAGGTTFAEIFYTKATADDRVDKRESDWFLTTHWALMYGMLVTLISGFALIAVQYLLPDSPQSVLYAPLWMQNTLVLIIVVTAWLMARGVLRWWLGSSLIFAGWWLMLALDAWQRVPLSYLTLLFVYALLVMASAAFWGYMRTLAHERARRSSRAS